MALLIEWGFNEGTGATAADSSGNGLDAVVTAWAPGRTGTAAVGDSTHSAFHRTGSPAALAGITLMGWVYPLNQDVSLLVAAADQTLTAGTIGVGVDSSTGAATFWSDNGTVELENVPTGIAANAWAHVALTVSATETKLYVNGSQVGSTLSRSGTITPIGHIEGGGAQAWTDYALSRAEDVRLFDAALTAADITTWMNTPVGGTLTKVLNIVAHQDDDLYFLPPYTDVAAGTATGTVYLSAGDGGHGWGTYAQGREAGAKAAWAALAGVGTPVWTDTTVTMAGKTVNKSTLGGTGIALYFLRFADGGYEDPTGGDVFLYKLYTGAISTLTSTDSALTVTKAQLTSVLAEIITASAATLVRTTNYLEGWNGDHTDHTASAKLAKDAVSSLSGVGIQGYLGYGTWVLPTNVSGMDLTAKKAAWAAYWPHDSQMTSTSWDNNWVYRCYPIQEPTIGQAAAGTTRRILTAADDTALPSNNDGTATVIGMPFSITSGTTLVCSGVRLYIPTGTNSLVNYFTTVSLWTSASPTASYPDTFLAGASVPGLTIGGATVVNFDNPVVLDPTKRYWVTAYLPNGYYPRDESLMATATTSADGRVLSPAGGTVPSNSFSQAGVDKVVNGSAPPTTNFGTPWYGIDVQVADLLNGYQAQGTVLQSNAVSGSPTVRAAGVGVVTQASSVSGTAAARAAAAGIVDQPDSVTGTGALRAAAGGLIAQTNDVTGNVSQVSSVGGVVDQLNGVTGKARLRAEATGVVAQSSAVYGNVDPAPDPDPDPDPDPALYDDPMFRVLSRLSDCLCAELEQGNGHGLCFCGLWVGSGQPPLGLSDCGNGDCGVAWVRFVGAFPSSNFPNPAQDAMTCASPLAYEIEIGVARCSPQAKGRDLFPDKQAVFDAARLYMGDMRAMRNALLCCLPKSQKKAGDAELMLQAAQYTPLDNAGGKSGGTWQAYIAWA